MQNFNNSYDSENVYSTSDCANNDIPAYTPISPQYSHTLAQGAAGRGTRNEGAAHVYNANQPSSPSSAAPYAATTQQFFSSHLNTPPSTQTTHFESFGGMGTGAKALAGTTPYAAQAHPLPASALYQGSSAQNVYPQPTLPPLQNYNIAQPAQNLTPAANMPYNQVSNGFPAGESTQNALNNILQAANEKAAQSAREKIFQNAILNLPLIAALAAQAPPSFPAQQTTASPPPASPTNPLMEPILSLASRIPQPQTLSQTGFLTAQQNNETEPTQLQKVQNAKSEHGTSHEKPLQNPFAAELSGDSETYWQTLTPTNAEYFQSTPARKTLKSYLQERCSYLDGAEIEEILTLAKELETQAVEVFKAKGTHKTKLQEQNRQAIDKLNTQAVHTRGSIPTQGATFTRSQIGKMSMKEFMENQAQILAQYAKGAIQ